MGGGSRSIFSGSRWRRCGSGKGRSTRRCSGCCWMAMSGPRGGARRTNGGRGATVCPAGCRGEQPAGAVLPFDGGGAQEAGRGEARLRIPAGRHRARHGGAMRPWKRLLHLVRRRRFEADLAEELRLHRQLAEDAARRAGAAPEEARRESARAFGSVALTLEDSRAVWRFAWLDSLAQDIRYALRGFRKSPGFAFAVIGTLALGLGVLATSFSVFNALVLRPFAVRDPYSLYTFAGWGQTKERPSHSPSTWREFTEFRRQNVAFSEVLGYQSRIASMAGKDASVLAVTGNYFNMLGGGICMGRPILESDDGPGDGVAVASYAAWKRRLGADPGAVGTKLYLRGRPVELVGVACPEFNGLEESRVDFWVSLALSGTLLGDADLFGPEEPPRLTVVGRLKAGVTPEGAEAMLLAYGRQVSPTWRIRLTYAATGAVVSVPENAKPPQSATLRQSATVLPLDRDSIGGFMPMFAEFGLILLLAW